MCVRGLLHELSDLLRSTELNREFHEYRSMIWCHFLAILTGKIETYMNIWWLVTAEPNSTGSCRTCCRRGLDADRPWSVTWCVFCRICGVNVISGSPCTTRHTALNEWQQSVTLFSRLNPCFWQYSRGGGRQFLLGASFAEHELCVVVWLQLKGRGRGLLDAHVYRIMPTSSGVPL